jgi:hypothetical protein
MVDYPFTHSSAGRKAIPNQRRSTRVEAVIPVFISGRDAASHPFRDETQTVTVSLHGARIQTRRDLLVGMQVTIESPRTRSAAKAICVRTNESVPGMDIRCVSVQLVKPGNIWGIENPPEDWAILENAEQEAQTADPAQPAKGVTPAAWGIRATQVAALEQQATQVTDAAAQRLRGLVEEMLGLAFEEFQQRLDAALAAAESRLNEHSNTSLAQLESTLKKFHEDLDDDLDLRAAQAVASTEESLRALVPNILASILSPSLQPPPALKADLKSKH